MSQASDPWALPDNGLIRARNLSKRYGDEFAVQGLDLDVAGGTIFGFIGPSGAGKTTTIRMLTGSEAPTTGTLTVLGKAPTAFGTRDRARLGYLPQLSVLYPHLSLWENLNFVASIYGLSLRRRARLRAALDFVELGEDRRKLLRNVSGGMQRRLALAAALVHSPELVFLDEPTAGIDPVLRRKVWDRFEALRTEGRTLFVTTQYVSEAAYCDVVAVIAEGRIVAVDTPDGLRRNAFGGEIIDVIATAPVADALLAELAALPAVIAADRGSDSHRLRVLVDDADRAIPRLSEWFDQRGMRLESVQQHVPPFDDVFVALVSRDRKHSANPCGS